MRQGKMFINTINIHKRVDIKILTFIGRTGHGTIRVGTMMDNAISVLSHSITIPKITLRT